MNNTQFLMIGFDAMDNKEFRKVMTSNKGCMLTWLWLRRNIVRAPMNNRYLKEVYERYYLKHLLATTAPIRNLTKYLNLSNKTLHKNLEALKEAGYIKIESIEKTGYYPVTNNDSFDFIKPQNIYVLGKWKIYKNDDDIENISEFLFLDDILANEALKNNYKETQRLLSL